MKEMYVCAVFSVFKPTSLCLLCLNGQTLGKNSPSVRPSLLSKRTLPLSLKHGTKCKVMGREESRIMSRKTMFSFKGKKRSVVLYCPVLYL